MLQELKTYLNISWSDELIDQKLTALIADSKGALNNLTGVELDYTDLQCRELLFNRIRYAYNNAIEYFEDNFHKEILRMQLMKGVEEVEK